MSLKQKIKILNSAGAGYTNPKKALKWVTQGRARYVDESSIEMVSEDRRHQACIASISEGRSTAKPKSPTPPRVIPFKAPAFQGQTFLHYPQAGSFECSSPGRPAEVWQDAAEALSDLLAA